MSILGIVVRTRPSDLASVEHALRALPGVDVAERADAADGRIVVVVEDTAGCAAAATMAEITRWPQVLNTSLVYEHSGPDAGDAPGSVEQYADWRASLDELARKVRGPA